MLKLEKGTPQGDRSPDLMEEKEMQGIIARQSVEVRESFGDYRIPITNNTLRDVPTAFSNSDTRSLRSPGAETPSSLSDFAPSPALNDRPILWSPPVTPGRRGPANPNNSSQWWAAPSVRRDPNVYQDV
jgi:hypothetical protein